MLKRNTAGQAIPFVMVNRTTGGPFDTTAGTTILVIKDTGSAVAGAGVFNKLADGCFSYFPTQAETDCSIIAVHAFNANAVPAGVTLATDDGLLDSIDFIKKVTEGDWVINTATDPWEEVVFAKGTVVQLIRRKIRRADGSNLNSTAHVPGRKTQA